ncbi:MAG: Gfo/Idh/MocA family oxidoreductase [Gemmatimonadetes bacterium]|nr:Gfo/Idh/MocA family oxidoreductase [Gemmatimonadota bacterium]MXY83052.1 Gfo/Idh/MocA family oxidoreductase [Gemmatimonadota bacterium]MYB66883.1 Gfo/Idh/MocA family oxidoreductase [Gemmatimonadota bacterium]
MTIKIGFVGTGGIANHHLRTLAQLDEAEMVAFCDVVEEKALDAASEYGGRAYSHYEALYDSEALDAVYICLPPFAHGQPELAAIERGLPIFVEKPVSTSLDQARAVEAALRAQNLISAVGYHWRYMDTTAKAVELLGDEPVGFALGAWTGGMPGVSWWRVLAESGGQIVEQTTHIFDLARYLLGEVESVHAMARTGLMEDVSNYDVHDASVTNLRFHSGAVASITSACMLSAGGHVGLELYQKDQVLRIASRALTIDRPSGREVVEQGNNPTQAEDRAFLQAVQTGDATGIRCDYAEAVKTLAVTLAATQSAIEGRVLSL